MGSRENIGLIILAAGASTRMGQPKQLLPYGSGTLIGHVIEAGLNSNCDPVVVVLGAKAGLIEKAISDLAIEVVKNRSWQEGMGSTIRVGLKQMLSLKAIDAVLITVCDQPGVTSQLLDNMIQLYRQNKPLGVACKYSNDILGVPALFTPSIFSELLKITGDRGARILLEKYRNQFEFISFPQGHLDIDTPEDYKRLMLEDKDKNE